MTSIAIIGPQGSGKSTLAEMLVEHRGYVRMGIADPIKALVRNVYGDIAKDHPITVRNWGGPHDTTGRELLQDIGAAMREVDLDFWLRQVRSRYLEAARAGMFVVLDDVRMSREAEYLRQVDPYLVVVRVSADAAKRSERIGRLISPSDVTETGWSQCEPDLILDTTDLTPEQAYRTLTDWLEAPR
jgi:dephospho-CoA kinase